jgi:NAD(P)-dependent dehydrogenase (short-subunit alcohol dehydrogenase family)
MNKPVTLVTGASRGIGYALCVQLAKAGHHVVALARTVGGLEALADEVGNDNITLIPQDLTDGKALEALGPMLFDKFGRLDNFIANAGMLGNLTPLSQCDPTEWNRVFAINVTANVHLIRTLNPLLNKSNNAHCVFLTSSVAQNPTAYWGAYAASKSALENMANTYAHEVENTNINVSIFNPGGTATKMRAQAFPGEDQATLPTAEDVATKILNLI